MRAPRLVLTVAFSACLFSACDAVGAGAYATVGAPPGVSSSSGLPDGRIYELATPFNKHGFQVGASGVNTGDKRPIFSIASVDGNAVSFEAKGPAAEIDSGGLSQNFVAERTSDGWTSRSSTARGLHQNEEVNLLRQTPIWRDYSPDLSHLAYSVTGPAIVGPLQGYWNFYLLGPAPLSEPTWLLRDAIQNKGSFDEEFPGTQLVGMAPDASIIYIADEARLLPQDGSRTGWGLYEYRKGTLIDAGVLPDGNVPASGVLPLATNPKPPHETWAPGQNNPASLDNAVSVDGARVFFQSAGELYVHQIEGDGSERSALISASKLPGHVGDGAPDGVAQFENLTKQASDIGYVSPEPTYGFASPDGSHLFFQSIDQLTSNAPSDAEPKVYDFDTESNSLEYLQNVTLGGIVTVARDGSSFLFANKAKPSPDLDLWSAGPGGGSVNQIAELPDGGFVGPGRMAADDSVVVFQAQAPIAGFNDAGGEQVYRYNVNDNELDCVSCPPEGIHPSGNSYLSAVDQYAFEGGNPEVAVVNDARGVSNNDEQIFFDSPDPLVGRDTNGKPDVYEWDNGTVFLVSSGTSPEPSWFLDNSKSGGDVFFSTSDELAEGDTDGGYDIYDARIPRPGDSPPSSAAPCSGAACQGPSSVAQLLGMPSSATFNGVGNVIEEHSTSKTKSAPKKLSRSQKLVNSLRACHKRRPKSAQVKCERRARRRYPLAEASAQHNRGGGK